MSEGRKAVFLSYASQDSEAAKRICEALRAAGIEVWFDQSELVGGDAWDAKIRKQIKDCALLIPIISAATQARTEGYFRLEWRLADQRTHLMAKGRPFLLPIVIDDTRDADAHVPDSFTEVQWTKLMGGETPPAFVARVAKLLSGEPGARSKESESAVGASPLDQPGALSPSKRLDDDRGRRPAAPLQKSRPWLIPAIIGAVALATVTVWLTRKPAPGFNPEPPVARAQTPDPKPAAPPALSVSPGLTEAQKFTRQARALLDDDPLLLRETYFLADELAQRAVKSDPTDGEAWAAAGRTSALMIQRKLDASAARRDLARMQVERAMSLAPASVESAFAQAWQQVSAGRRDEARVILEELSRKAPDDWRLWDALGQLSLGSNQWEAAIGYFREAEARSGGSGRASAGVARGFVNLGRMAEARIELERALAGKPSRDAYLRHLLFLAIYTYDVAATRAFIARIPPRVLQEDAMISTVAEFYLRTGEGDRALQELRRMPRDFFEDGWDWRPRGYLAGYAHQVAGRTTAAQAEWKQALVVVEKRLAAEPNETLLLYWQSLLQALTGQTAEARAGRKLLLELQSEQNVWFDAILQVAIGDREAAIEALVKGWPKPEDSRRLDFWGDVLYAPWFAALRDDPRIRTLALKEKAVIDRQLRGPAAAAVPKAKADLSTEALAKVDDKSVAVLAFANLSSDKEQEFFSDGISEEVLNVLAKVPGLKVSARTSAFYFKGRQVPMAEIASQLGVTYLVEGSVQRAGDRVKITAQLIKAADGFHVWSDSFTRDMKDIFAVQDEIAGKIASSLTDKLGMTLPVSAKTTPEAYTLYLQARSTLAKRGVPNLREAAGMFEKVIALDPDYLPARSGMAITLALLPAWSRSLALGESLEMINRAKREARVVIELQPGNAEAWSALGYMLAIYDWRWQEAGEAVARSVALAPNDAEIANFAGDYYRLVLADQQMVEAEKRAVELNPLQAVNHSDLSVCYRALHQSELALEPARRAISIAPEVIDNYEYLLRVYGALKRFDEMRPVLAAVQRVAPPESAVVANMEILIAIYEGRSADGLRLLEKFRPYVEQGGYSPAEYGFHYLRLGQPEQALPWLLLGAKGRDASLVDPSSVDLELIAAHPVTRSVLEEPGLKELMEIRARHARAAPAQK